MKRSNFTLFSTQFIIIALVVLMGGVNSLFAQWPDDTDKLPVKKSNTTIIVVSAVITTGILLLVIANAAKQKDDKKKKEQESDKESDSEDDFDTAWRFDSSPNHYPGLASHSGFKKSESVLTGKNSKIEKNPSYFQPRLSLLQYSLKQ